MERLDALDAARQIVSTRFPDARAAFLTGSILTAHRTSTSDLDIVIVLNGPPAPFRETLREHGWPVELFVQTLASIKYFSELEAKNLSGVTLKMISDGFILHSVESLAEQLQTDATQRLTKGPDPLSEHEMRRRRYLLTDQLDDLIGSTHPIEIMYITQQLLIGCSELALITRRKWLSSGKWLSRSLATCDPDFSDRLYQAARSVLIDDDKAPMHAVTREVLKRVGGPLTEGYKVEGEILG